MGPNNHEQDQVAALLPARERAAANVDRLSGELVLELTQFEAMGRKLDSLLRPHLLAPCQINGVHFRYEGALSTLAIERLRLALRVGAGPNVPVPRLPHGTDFQRAVYVDGQRILEAIDALRQRLA